MNVYLTFDIEIWCNGWSALEREFPASFQRYVYGRSAAGDYALPKTLEILHRHGLQGVFFVEPLFSARFGPEPLATVVRLIREAGQDVQLHLHPEWTDEARTPLIEDSRRKRQHLSYYTLDEQATLIGWGRQALEAAGSGPISAFRSGSFAANRDTFEALRRNGILLDSSLNRCHEVSAPELQPADRSLEPFDIAGVTTFPVTVFRDGSGRDRPAQIGACSFAEMRDALQSAEAAGHQEFVLVSHNFEMLKPGSSERDRVVARRFERLCAFLSEQRGRLPTRTFAQGRTRPARGGLAAPRASFAATAQRYAEQALRRLA